MLRQNEFPNWKQNQYQYQKKVEKVGNKSVHIGNSSISRGNLENYIYPKSLLFNHYDEYI